MDSTLAKCFSLIFRFQNSNNWSSTFRLSTILHSDCSFNPRLVRLGLARVFQFDLYSILHTECILSIISNSKSKDSSCDEQRWAFAIMCLIWLQCWNFLIIAKSMWSCKFAKLHRIQNWIMDIKSDFLI